jgi:hypothetical protein
MMLTRAILFLGALLMSSASNSAPMFEAYFSEVEPSLAPVKIQPTSKLSRQYRTQLTAAASQPINFAGHFILAQWGCGAGCVMAAAIDAKTGKVAMLPFTVSDWPLDVTEPISFRKDSALLIVQGSRNERAHGIYYYRFDGTQFRLLSEQENTAK